MRWRNLAWIRQTLTKVRPCQLWGLAPEQRDLGP